MPILVIGPQRTGTSLVAGILQRLGVDMLVNPISPNAEYCESDEWMRVCHAICGDWHCPQFHYAEKPAIDAIHALVKKHEDKMWGAKTAFFPLIGHMLVNLIPDVRVIRTTRTLELTVKSLLRRDRNIQPGVAEYIQKQAFAAVYLTDKACENNKTPTALIKYDDLLREPEKVINAISAFALPEKTDITKALELVDPLLRHFEEPDYGAVA